jgi:hypothetical protein
MEPVISAQFGIKNDQLAALNSRNREVWKERQKQIERLCFREEILEASVQRINSTTALLRAPTDPNSALVRLRNARSFEQEVLDFAVILSSSELTRAQSKRGKDERIKVGTDRIPIREVTRVLVSRPDYRDVPPRELWTHFYSKLSELDCEPTLFDTTPLNLQKIEFEYYKFGAALPSRDL